MNAISRQVSVNKQVVISGAEHHLLSLFRLMSSEQKNVVFSVCDDLLSGKAIIPSQNAGWELVDEHNQPIALTKNMRFHLERMCTNLEFMRAWWGQFGEALSEINPAVASSIHDRFIDGAISSRLVTKELGFESSIEYAKNYPFAGSYQEKKFYADQMK